MLKASGEVSPIIPIIKGSKGDMNVKFKGKLVVLFLKSQGRLVKVLETSGEASEITPKFYVKCTVSRPFSSLPLFEPKQGLFFSLFLSQFPTLGIITIKIQKLLVKNTKVEKLL